MIQHIRKFALAGALLASLALAAAPAEARHRYYSRHHDRTGTAIAAGVVGLAVGAALASGSRDRYYGGSYHDSGYYYDRGYYPQAYYPRYRTSYYYPRYRTYYDYDRYDRYERKHRRWHRRHGY
ncbi:MAG TPA: hypothetical protein VM055_01010 [Novosphingobium sp.]|nr:hypothetical protein [Novosphingobium sp.]